VSTRTSTSTSVVGPRPVSTLLAPVPVPELEPAGTAVRPEVRPSWLQRLAARIGSGLARAVVVAVGLFWLFPTLGLAVASLRSAADNSATGWWTALTAPAQLTLDNYAALLSNERITGSLWNTVLIAVPSTVLVLGLGSLGAYALAWLRFPGRNLIFVLSVALTIVPVQVAVIPDAAVFRALGIFGDYPAVIAFHVAFGLPFAVFLLRNYLLNLPEDMIEAARADGAGEFTVFRRVALPFAWPALGSLAIFQFLWVWNDLLVALVFGFNNPPITYAIREQTRAFATNIDVIAPGALVSMAVPLILFFAFQRYFLRGALDGALK
jgi:alpha-glucoside transport system permease protein